MALASSCPGTVLAQIGVGVPSGLPALGGAILGGLVWTGILRPWLRAPSSRRTAPAKEPSRTVHESLGLNKHVVTAGFEALLAAAVAGLTVLSARSRGTAAAHAIRPVVGGLLIGLAQLTSLLLRRSALGVSTAYEEAGDLLWWPLYTPDALLPEGTSLMFAGGIVAGAWALSHAVALPGSPVPITIPAGQSVLGGFLMVLGARIAGGCTSGHGISGLSLLSVSSFVTIGSALVAGALTAKMFL
jgi:hypothetical protein